MQTSKIFDGLTAALAAATIFPAFGLAFGPAIAHADDFPNLDSFTAVPPDTFFVTNENSTVRSIQFSTPDGIGCMFRASEVITPSSRQRLSCDGPIPGMPAGTPSAATVPGLGGLVPGIGCPMGTAAQKGDGPFELSKGTWSCSTKPDAPELGVGQKLTYGNVTCVVGAGNLTACQVTKDDQTHGFVLQPLGSRGF
jgi:hypothetical protein